MRVVQKAVYTDTDKKLKDTKIQKNLNTERQVIKEVWAIFKEAGRTRVSLFNSTVEVVEDWHNHIGSSKLNNPFSFFSEFFSLRLSEMIGNKQLISLIHTGGLASFPFFDSFRADWTNEKLGNSIFVN